MKYLLFLLLLVPSVCGQKLSVEYDKFKNLTTVRGKDTDRLKPSNRFTGPPPTFNVYGFYSGEQPKASFGYVLLVFRSRSRDWQFLKQNNLVLLLDGTDRVWLGNAVADRNVRWSNVTEQLAYKLKLADAEKVVRAGTVELKLGTLESKLTAEQVGVLRAVVDSVKP